MKIIYFAGKLPQQISGYKWNGLSAWWLHMAILHYICLRGLCGYVWINILYHPQKRQEC